MRDHNPESEIQDDSKHDYLGKPNYQNIGLDDMDLAFWIGISILAILIPLVGYLASGKFSEKRKKKPYTLGNSNISVV